MRCFFMNRQKIFIILIITLMIFSLSIDAKVTLDETKMYIKAQPLNYIISGEDCTYYKWIEKYEQKRQNYKINTPSVKTKAIIGKMKEDYIEYDHQRDVKNISINLEKINQVRNQGDIIGMFVEKGKVYVAIEQADREFMINFHDINLMLSKLVRKVLMIRYLTLLEK